MSTLSCTKNGYILPKNWTISIQILDETKINDEQRKTNLVVCCTFRRVEINLHGYSLISNNNLVDFILFTYTDVCRWMVDILLNCNICLYLQHVHFVVNQER